MGRSHHRHAGFTLVETLVAAAMVMVLLVAIGSVVTASARALPGSDPVVEARSAGSAALRAVESDLACARSITALTPTSVSFTLADRTGDGVEENETVSWDGTAGGSLVRTINGTTQTLLAHAWDFALEAVTSTDPGGAGGSTSSTSDEILAACELHGTTTAVGPLAWSSQYFVPRLPATTTSFSITRVDVGLYKHGTVDSVVSVELYRADAQWTRTGLAIWSNTINENSLPSVPNGGDASPVFTSIAVSGVSGLAPGAYVLLLRAGPLGTVATTVLDPARPDPDAAYLSTATGGLSYTTQPDASIPFRVWGRITTLSVMRLPMTRVESVNVRVRASSRTDTLVRSAVHLAASPQLGGGG